MSLAFQELAQNAGKIGELKERKAAEEEIDAKNKQPGAVWCKRRMIPGGEGFLSRFRQDKFIFDEASHAYVIDKSGSSAFNAYSALTGSVSVRLVRNR